MAEAIVVNTGPLVSFAAIGCLDLIGRLPYDFLSPAFLGPGEVWQKVDETAGPRNGYSLPLVDVAARADFVDQQRSIVEIGEENSPIANSEAVAILLAAFEVPYVALTFVAEKVYRIKDSLLCWPVET